MSCNQRAAQGLTDAAAFDPFTPAYVGETAAGQQAVNNANMGVEGYQQPAANMVDPYQQQAGKVSAQSIDPNALAGKMAALNGVPAGQTGAAASQTFVSPYMAAVPGTSGRPAAAQGTMPITPLTQPAAVTLESLQYFNGYLRTQIGRKVTVDFLIGTNTFIDKTGTLLGVGANYLLLREIESDDLLICDFFSVKFVTVYY